MTENPQRAPTAGAFGVDLRPRPSARGAAARAPGLETRVPGAAVCAAVLAALLVALVFRPVLEGAFLNFDDRYLYVENDAYRGFDLAHLAWMFRSTRLGHWAPLTWLSAALDHALFGLDPRAFHRTSLVLHAANTALVGGLAFEFLRRTLPSALSTRERGRPVALAVAAGLAALLFGLHPMRAEPVAWITERRGLLGAFFLLLAFALWLRACAPGRVALASRTAYVASLVALLASLLSKGLGMSFVAIVVLLDVCPLRRLPARVSEWTRPELRPIWIQKLPPLALGLGSAFVSAWAASSAGETVRSLDRWGAGARIGQAAYGLLYYLRKSLWPSGLSPLHELPFRFDFLEPRFLLSAIAVVLLAAVLLRARRRAPSLATAAVAYALALAPVLGLAQAGPQLVAERYAYVACIPLAILAAGAGLVLWLRLRAVAVRAAFGLVVAAWLCFLAMRSREEISVWRDSRTLWEHVAASGEPSAIAHNNLGAMDSDAGAYESAIEHQEIAVSIRPDLGRAWLNLGVDCAREGRLEQALAALLQARANLQPPTEALVELGQLYLRRLDRPDDALAAFGEAVAQVESGAPKNFTPLPYLGLGVALLRKGEGAEGRRRLEYAAQFPETRERALEALRVLEK